MAISSRFLVQILFTTPQEKCCIFQLRVVFLSIAFSNNWKTLVLNTKFIVLPENWPGDKHESN